MHETQFSFGSFELLPRQRRLLNAGKPVALGDRALDLLIILAASGGNLVTKQELLERLWPDSIVDETALRVHVCALRKVLRNGVTGDGLIVNVQGRGYCLTAPVSVTPALNRSTTATLPPQHDANFVRAAHKKLLGRDQVALQLEQRLRQDRLLTVVGSGGIGKTSVALMVAESASRTYRDGVVFVDLTAISDSALLCSEIARCVNLAANSVEPLAALIDHFTEKDTLLILDNCEHLIEAVAAVVERLWRTVPTIYILATSREPLRADGESVHWLPSLAYPADVQTLDVNQALKFPAIELLAARASAHDSTFQLSGTNLAAAAELCRRLDGIPLAIELAASAVRVFGLTGVAEQLDRSFLTAVKGRRTALPRHRSLGAMLDWSYSLLSNSAQLLLRRLAIFPGGIDLAAAQSVVADDSLSTERVLEGIYGLHEKSLLIADFDSGAKDYRLLETTRAYALQKLRMSGEWEYLAKRHADFLCDYFKDAEADWDSQTQCDWLAVYGRRLVDLRAALTWALSDAGVLEIGAKLLALSTPLWAELALASEYLARLETVLQRMEHVSLQDPSLQPRLKVALAQAIWISRGPDDRMLQLCHEALALAEQQRAPLQQIQALWGLWNGGHLSGDAQTLRDVSERIQRISEQSSQPIIQLAGMRIAVLTNHYLGSQKQAWEHQEPMRFVSDATFHQFGKIGYWLNQKLPYLTMNVRLLWLRGYPDQAMQAALDGIDYARTINRPANLAYFLGFAACPMALWYGNIQRARDFTSMLEDLSKRHSLIGWRNMAAVYGQAIVHLAKAADVSRARPTTWDLEHRFSRHHLELFSSLHEDFVAPSILNQCEVQEAGWCLSEALRAKAKLSADPQVSEYFLLRSLQVARDQGARSWELRAGIDLARLWKSQHRVAEAQTFLAEVYQGFTEGFASSDLMAAEAILA